MKRTVTRHTHRAVAGIVLFMGIAFSGTHSDAAIVTIADDNSRITVETDKHPVVGERGGLKEWRVDGVNHLWSEWIWVSVNHGPEFPIDHILDVGGSCDIAKNENRKSITLEYTWDGVVSVNVTYYLYGEEPGSNKSHLGEDIRVCNLDQHKFPINVFVYTDFDLNGDLPDEGAVYTAPSITQADGLTRGTVSAGYWVPYRYRLDETPKILQELNDGNFDPLPNAFPSIHKRTDISSAFEFSWENVEPNTSRERSVYKSICSIPELPSVAIWSVLGSLGILVGRWRRRGRAY